MTTIIRLILSAVVAVFIFAISLFILDGPLPSHHAEQTAWAISALALFTSYVMLPKWRRSAANAKVDFDNRKDVKAKHYREMLVVAEREINLGEVDDGIWAQALVEANGDESKRGIKYMDLRAKQLSSGIKNPDEGPDASD